MSKHRIVALLLLFFISVGLLHAPVARAEEGADESEEAFTVIREGELEEIIETFIREDQVWAKGVGIGFLYTATGEEWYYNGDKFFYSASLYKVPLLMLISNMVARGELEQDAEIDGFLLTNMEKAILTVSNNPFAHLLMKHFWRSGKECRTYWPALAGMEPEELPSSFYTSSEFSPRFMTRVMYTLYSDPESYPMMLDFLKQATPHMYFRYQLEDQYEIAEKYGYYENSRHVTGIIYTEHPIIITYMSRDNGPLGRFSSDLAVRLVEYSKLLDERLDAHEEELRQEEERRKAAEEAEKRAAEEAAAKAKAEAEAAAQAKAEAEAAAKAAEEAARRKSTILLYSAVSAGFLLLATLLIVLIRRRKRNRTAKEAERTS